LRSISASLKRYAAHAPARSIRWAIDSLDPSAPFGRGSFSYRRLVPSGVGAVERHGPAVRAIGMVARTGLARKTFAMAAGSGQDRLAFAVSLLYWTANTVS
jgi:hypothetical protein